MPESIIIADDISYVGADGVVVVPEYENDLSSWAREVGSFEDWTTNSAFDIDTLDGNPSEPFRNIILEIAALPEDQRLPLAAALIQMVNTSTFDRYDETMKEWFLEAAVFYAGAMVSGASAEQLQNYFDALDYYRSNNPDRNSGLNFQQAYVAANGISIEQAALDIQSFVMPTVETLQSWGIAPEYYASILGLFTDSYIPVLGSDINQNNYGSCAMLAVIESVLNTYGEQGEDYLNSLITDHGDNTYTVAFQWEGAPLDVPVNLNEILSDRDDSWVDNAVDGFGYPEADAPQVVQILEAAYIKALWSGEFGLTYSDARMASDFLLGQQNEEVSVQTQYTLLPMVEPISLSEGMILTLTTSSEASEREVEGFRIIPNHAYSAEVQIINGETFYNIRDPWNTEEAILLTADEVNECFSLQLISPTTKIEAFISENSAEVSSLVNPSDYPSLSCENCIVENLSSPQVRDNISATVPSNYLT